MEGCLSEREERVEGCLGGENETFRKWLTLL